MRTHAHLKKNFVAAVRETWGPSAPEWVQTLAAHATATTLSAVARQVKYSVATLSHVIAGNYAGDMGRVEKAVRGALMNETVECPVVGEIKLDRCLFEQGRADRGASAMRTRLYHKCRGIGTERCPHSLIGREGKAS